MRTRKSKKQKLRAPSWVPLRKGPGGFCSESAVVGIEPSISEFLKL